MKYYLLRTPSDPKIIGVKNGIAQVEIKERGFSDKEMFNRIMTFFDSFKYWEKTTFAPDSDFNIEYAKTLKNAKITDFISFGPFLIACPFIINEKVKNIFDLYHLQEHYYIPISLYKDEQLIQESHYLFYSPFYGDYDIIDFQNSQFFTGNELVKNKKIYKFKNKQEYLDFLKQDIIVRSDKIVLNEEFDQSLDFFTPRFGGIYISEKLKKTIEKEKLTGINIMETREPIIVCD